MEMITVSEAKRLVRNHTGRIGPVRVPIPKSLGLTLSNDVTSPVDIPSFPQSSMDGYAFAHDSLSNHASLKVVGTVAAGSDETPVVRVGQAVRIFTGAPLPERADTVVMQEKCTRIGDLLTLAHLPAKGENVRQPGSEAAKGTLALAAGQTMTPAGIGFLSGLGLTEVEGHPMPSGSILVTGLGAAPVDADCTVVQVDVRGVPQVVPFAVRPGADGSIACMAADAVVTGSIQYEDRFRNLGWWRDMASEARWPLAVQAAGTFDATVDYAASAECGGTGEWQLRVDGRTVASGTVELPGRKDWGDFATARLGRVALPAGHSELVVKAARKNGDSFINLRRVDLRPATGD